MDSVAPIVLFTCLVNQFGDSARFKMLKWLYRSQAGGYALDCTGSGHSPVKRYSTVAVYTPCFLKVDCFVTTLLSHITQDEFYGVREIVYYRVANCLINNIKMK